MNRMLSRRTILRGAGVALTLPWLESLLPSGKAARAADVVRKRYLPIYIPNGTAPFWQPSNTGVGDAWKLSPILDPLSAIKSKVTVLTGFENGTAFNSNRSSSVEPSHGRQPGAWLTCQDPAVVSAQLDKEANIPSVDQRIAKFLKAQGQLPFDSLQVGLSTTSSSCDGQPCSNSRTLSWSDTNLPMYKMVDPLAVFNKLVTVANPTNPDGMMDAATQKRLALNKSVLDAVLANANATKGRLGMQDQQRLDEFLTAVREVEVKATTTSSGMGGLACMAIDKPTMSDPNKPINNNNYARNNTATYNKGTHADVMHDLIVMAFQCDATRVITYMMEDERSEFAYDNVKRRTFSATGSTEASGNCGEWHNGGQHGDVNDYATIVWWNTQKLASLATKLDAIKEEDGKSVLDNTLIMYGSCMESGSHACRNLPILLIGSGGGSFKTDQHVKFGADRWLRDLHHTVMTKMYGMSGADVDSFGVNRDNVPRSVINEILAV